MLSISPTYHKRHNKFLLFRMLLYYALASIITIAISVLGFCCFPHKRLAYKITTSWCIINIALLKYICGLNYVIKGKKYIPQQACIVISNHQSMWETILMPALFPHQTWLLKKELFKIPFFGWSLKYLGAIPIDRKLRLQANRIIELARAKLAAGVSIMVFPEGTRIPYGTTKPFSQTAAAIAIASNTPILPMAHNAGLFWPKGLWPEKTGTIEVTLGPLIYPKPDEAPKDLIQRVEAWIRLNSN